MIQRERHEIAGLASGDGRQDGNVGRRLGRSSLAVFLAVDRLLVVLVERLGTCWRGVVVGPADGLGEVVGLDVTLGEPIDAAAKDEDEDPEADADLPAVLVCRAISMSGKRRERGAGELSGTHSEEPGRQATEAGPPRRQRRTARPRRKSFVSLESMQ